MTARLDLLDQRLLDEFQRDLPLVPRPFLAIGEALGISEADVIARLAALQAAGMITRVGATIRPNTVGASTLAALAVPEERIDEVAAHGRRRTRCQSLLSARGQVEPVVRGHRPDA